MSNIERLFPGLANTGYRYTSPMDVSYNCIAWAAGDTSQWWEPDAFGQYFWPDDASRSNSVDAYCEAFALLGFERCSDADFENGHVKVAIFVNRYGTPQHAARQLPTGRWTSKIGKLEDIEHDLFALEGSEYGRVAEFLKRPVV